MWNYEKRLQYPINITKNNPKIAQIIISQYGGPDGELKASGFDTYYVDHTLGVYPQAASGTPHSAKYYQSKGDALTNLFEDMAAEQKARTTYDNILRMVKDPEVCDPIRFLRAREIVHFQRFGEALRLVTEKLDSKNYYMYNPEFDKCK